MNVGLQLFWKNPIDVNSVTDNNIVIELPFGAMIKDPSSGGGGIQSVNGDFGPYVELDYIDVGAEPAGSVANLKSYVDTQDSLKADKTYVDEQVDLLGDAIFVKANKVYVDQQDQIIRDIVDTKADEQAVNQALTTKADLDSSGKVPASQLPSYVDDVVEGTYVDPTTFNDLSGNPYTPEAGKVYVDVNTNKTYRWSGMLYVVIGGGGVALGETSETAYRGDRGKIAYDHSQSQGNPHNSTTSDITEGNRLYFTEPRVRLTPMTGLSLADSNPIVQTDTLLQAIGKAQAQFNNIENYVRNTALTGLTTENAVISATDNVLNAFGKLQGQLSAYVSGLETSVRLTKLTGFFPINQLVTSSDTLIDALSKLQGQFTNFTNNFGLAVQNNVLSAYVVGTNTAITNNDTVVTAFGKLQAQLNNFASNVRSTVLTGLNTSIVTPVLATDTVLSAIGKLQGQIDRNPPSSWVDVATLAGTQWHTNVARPPSKIEVTRRNGSVYMRGWIIASASGGVPVNIPVVTWTHIDYLVDPNNMNIDTTAYTMQCGSGHGLYSSSSTTIQNFVSEQSNMINVGLSLKLVTSALPAGARYYIAETCLGKSL